MTAISFCKLGKLPLKNSPQVSVSFFLLWLLLIAQLIKKNPPAMQETPVRFLAREDPLKKG